MKKVLLGLVVVFGLYSCTKKEDEPSLSADEAKTAITEIAGNFETDIIDMMESEGMSSMTSLFDYTFASSEFGDLSFRKEEHKLRIVEFARIFAVSPAARVGTETPSDFPTGIYSWNTEEQDFVFVEEASVLILQFPTEGSETNNAVFTLSQLAFDINELPTAIEASITVDSELIVSVDLSANWSVDGLPELVNLTLFIKPFTLSLTIDDTGAKTSKLAASLTNGGTLLAAIDLKVTYNNTAKEFPNTISGYVQYRTLKVDGSLDLAGALMSNSGNPNEFINLIVYVDEVKVGKIIFVEEAYDDGEYSGYDYVPYIKYNDGSMEPLADLFGNALADMETRLEEM
jgi:hypothetical protein